MDGVIREKRMIEGRNIKVTSSDITKMKEKLLLSKREFTILETIHPKIKGKLGSVNKAMFKG